RSEAVASGEEALARVRASDPSSKPFQVLLLDFLMPGMNGVAVARELRAEPSLRDAVIVILSSVERRTTPRPVPADAPFDAWLVNPVRESRLMDTIVAAWTLRHGGVATEARVGRAEEPLRPAALSARVLVVDDSAVNQRVAALPLEKLGCRVDVAGN